MLLSNWVKLTTTLGHSGPEGGETLMDDELPDVGRVVVEKKVRQKDLKEYFAVTVFVYNKLVHTAYFQDWDDVLEHLTSTKILIQAVYGE